MKELSIKEKAHRYDKALRVVEKLHRSWKETQNRAANEIEEAFPEFKEGEDERIRKELISLIKETHVTDRYYDLNKMLDWLEKQGEQDEECKEINLVEILKHYPKETELFSPLYGKLWLAEVDEKNEIITCYKHHLEKGCTRAVLEQEDSVSFYSNGTTGLPDFSISKDCMLFLYDKEKQGEQKPTDKVEPKFNVGDWVVCCNYEPEQIIGIRNDMYEMSNGDIRPIKMINKNHNIRLWTIQDAKDGDVLYYKSSDIEYIVMNKGINKYNNIDSYFRYNSLNGFGVGIPSVLSVRQDGITPATKEQHDLLFSKMKEAGYGWDAQQKVLKKIEQKPVWNEEDDIEISVLINALGEFETYGGDFSKQKNWLKSLKEKMQQCSITDEELTQAKKQAYNDALDKIEYHSGEPTFDDGWSAAIWYLKKKNTQFSSTWKPTEEQMSCLAYVMDKDDCYGKDYTILRSLYDTLKKLV